MPFLEYCCFLATHNSEVIPSGWKRSQSCLFQNLSLRKSLATSINQQNVFGGFSCCCWAQRHPTCLECTEKVAVLKEKKSNVNTDTLRWMPSGEMREETWSPILFMFWRTAINKDWRDWISCTGPHFCGQLYAAQTHPESISSGSNINSIWDPWVGVFMTLLGFGVRI